MGLPQVLCKGQPDNGRGAARTDRDRKRLQARAFRVIEEVFGRLGEEVAGKTVLSQFEHYDFRGLGVVGIPEFCKAALRAGFTYTRAELRALAEDFLAQTNTDNALAAPVVEYAVHYRRFVSWATPTIEALSQAAVHAHNLKLTWWGRGVT